MFSSYFLVCFFYFHSLPDIFFIISLLLGGTDMPLEYLLLPCSQLAVWECTSEEHAVVQDVKKKKIKRNSRIQLA